MAAGAGEDRMCPLGPFPGLLTTFKTAGLGPALKPQPSPPHPGPHPHLRGGADDGGQGGFEEPVGAPGRGAHVLGGRRPQADRSGGLRGVAIAGVRRADGVRVLLPKLLLVLVNVRQGRGALQTGSQQEGLWRLRLWSRGAWRESKQRCNTQQGSPVPDPLGFAS